MDIAQTRVTKFFTLTIISPSIVILICCQVHFYTLESNKTIPRL